MRPASALLSRAMRSRNYSSSSDGLVRWLENNAARPTQRVPSRLDTDQASLLSSTIHDDPREFRSGECLPPMWHLVYFPARHTLEQLGKDGHASDIHPPGFNRRMWAGGRISWNLDNPATLSTSEHEATLAYSPQYKIRTGKRGPMVFVEELREVVNSRGWCVREQRDVVYLTAAPPAEGKGDGADAAAKSKEGGAGTVASGSAPAAPSAASPKESVSADFERTVIPNEVMLFRFSALTWNGHRIHYDEPYVTGVEGYKGLVTHGPLVSLLLIDTLHCQVPSLRCNVASRLPLEPSRLKTWTYRALNPWIVGEPVVLKGKFDADGCGAELWAENAAGRRGMEGRVTW
ncbi:hypothetical protein DFJ74DRAFT_682811 [Hyaloraphidium curvatum]|nr:hypothetical protein DFJ74DRAFT_682811 [Hyaloraphidium curvatum]